MSYKKKNPFELSPESEERRRWQIAAKIDQDLHEQEVRYNKYWRESQQAAAKDPNYVYKPYRYDEWGDSPETEKKLQKLAKNAIEGAKRREVEWENEARKASIAAATAVMLEREKASEKASKKSSEKASEKRGGSKKKTVKRRSRKYGKTKRRK